MTSPTARESESRSGKLSQRLFWFGALWLVGVVTVTVVAYAIRAMIMP